MGIDFQTEWEAFKALPSEERQGVFKRLYGHSGAHLQETLLAELVKTRLQEIHLGALSSEEFDGHIEQSPARALVKHFDDRARPQDATGVLQAHLIRPRVTNGQHPRREQIVPNANDDF